MRNALFALILGTAACAGSAEYRATATYSSPDVDMVAVSPGVQVIADYDEPIFYSGGYYWRSDNNGIWYRSSSWTGGWVSYRAPQAILRVERPHAYVHYRPHGYVERRPARVYREHYRSDRRGPYVRDHR